MCVHDDDDIVTRPRSSYGARPARPLRAVLKVTEGKRQEKKRKVGISKIQRFLSRAGAEPGALLHVRLIFDQGNWNRGKTKGKKSWNERLQAAVSSKSLPICDLPLKMPALCPASMRSCHRRVNEEWKPVPCYHWMASRKKSQSRPGCRMKQRFAVKWGQVRTINDNDKKTEKD
jgi:hypothetical protein